MIIYPSASWEALETNKHHTLEKTTKALDRSWLSYIIRLIKEPIKLTYINQTYSFEPSDVITISPCFFRDFVCTNCGRCCRNINTFLFYTRSELVNHNIDINSELRACGFAPFLLIVETKEKALARVLYASKWNISDGGVCPWLTTGNAKAVCKIHNVKPLQCILSPVYTDLGRRKRTTKSGVRQIVTTRLTKRLLGRNWRFGCEMVAQPSSPKILYSDILKLKMLLSIADYLGIVTCRYR